MLVIAAPGQGAQTPGFLSPWLELPGFAERVGAWSELAGVDLIRYGTTADADEIRDTAIAQPLLVAAAIAAAQTLFGGLDQALSRSANPGSASHSRRKPGVWAPWPGAAMRSISLACPVGVHHTNAEPHEVLATGSV